MSVLQRAASLLARARAALTAGTVELVLYMVNLDNGRGTATLAELRALDESERATRSARTRTITGPAIIGCVEATGNQLPHLPGMAFETGRGESRSNIAIYIRRELLRGGKIRGRWTDLRRTWPRTKYPGPHPARSFFTVTNAGRVQVIDAHVPPDVPGAGPAREEIVDALVHALAPWTRPGWRRLRAGQKKWRSNRPRLLFIDHNGVGDEIAQRTGMRVVGRKVDALLVGGDLEVSGHRYLDSFPLPPAHGGKARPAVPFRGDHHDVLRVVVRVPAKYLPTLNRLSEVPS